MREPKIPRVMKSAVSKLTATPNDSVKANPFTIVAPKVEPNQKRITPVIIVAKFESRMDGHARFQPNSNACGTDRPLRNSSLMRSN